MTSRELTAYREARRLGRLPLRTVCMPLSHQLDAYVSVGLAGPFGDDRLSIGAMKFYADGSLIGGTASFSDPYGACSELPGLMYWTPAELAQRIGQAHRAGWQVGVHVQGDQAMTAVLDALEAAVRAPRDHRHRLEHAGYPTPEQITRIARLGAITVNQPSYLFDSGEEFLAPARAAGPPPAAAARRARRRDHRGPQQRLGRLVVPAAWTPSPRPCCGVPARARPSVPTRR